MFLAIQPKGTPVPWSQMTVPVPFSSDHMRLVRPLPASARSRTRAAGRWLSVAHPALDRFTRRRARRRGVPSDAVDDLVGAVLLRIYERLLADHYAQPGSLADDERIVLAHVDNLIRAHVRARKREAERLYAVGDAVDVLPDDHVADPVDAWHAAALARREADLIRRLDASAVQRLVVLLHVHPEEVSEADLAAAVATSRVTRRGGQHHVVGLTRPTAETLDLLAAWLPSGTRLADLGGAVGRHGPVRTWLAWILRGTAGSRDIGDWSRTNHERAVNWLDQQLSRGRRALRTTLRR